MEKKERVAITLNLDRDIVKVLRDERKGHISDDVNEMFYLASGHGKIACPECKCEFSVPAGRKAFYQKRIENPYDEKEDEVVNEILESEVKK